MKTNPFTHVIAIQNDYESWDCVTSFLKNGIGTALGKSTDLSQSEAEALAARWNARIAGNEHVIEAMKPAQRLKSWEGD